MIDLNKNNEYKVFLAETKEEYLEFENDLLQLIKTAKTVVKYGVNVDGLADSFNELFIENYHEIQLKLFHKALECTNKDVNLITALDALGYNTTDAKHYIFNANSLNTDTALSIPEYEKGQLLELIFWYATMDVEYVLRL